MWAEFNFNSMYLYIFGLNIIAFIRSSLIEMNISINNLK